MPALNHSLRQFLLQPARHLLTPPGTGGWRDRMVLRAWDSYAALQSARIARPSMPAAKRSAHDEARPTYDAAFFREHLATQLLPFWAKHALDREQGGYVTHLDRQGRVYQNDLRLAAMQARLVYSFIAGYDALREPAYLEAAQHGFRFMRERLWDAEHGGWLASVHRDGRPHATHKWLFDQAYALLAMAEYQRVTGDPSAAELAQRTWALLETHAWDAAHGGYYESRERDWGRRSNDKTLCVQVDMLAALLLLYPLTRDPAVLHRIGALARALTAKRDPRSGLLLERFRENWVYYPVPVLDQVLVGHSLKAATLLLRSSRLSGQKDLIPMARALVEASLEHGWDPVYGGFYQFVYRRGSLARSVKEWWAECEGLLALTLLHQATGEAHYEETFRALAGFTFTHFADPDYGDWYATCHPDGTVHNPVKGYTYKTAFHPVETCCDLIRYRATVPA